MLRASKSLIKTKRKLFVVMLLTLLCGAIVLGFAHRISQRLTGNADAPVRHERVAQKGERAGARSADETSALPEAPQMSAQFDLSRNVIAGGGGTSSNGSVRLDGTIGQQTAGATSSNGQFSLTGGFWQPEANATGTPTP